jgi:hypothetical protein
LGIADALGRKLDDAFRVEYEPLRCHAKGCAAVLNPYW